MTKWKMNVVKSSVEQVWNSIKKWRETEVPPTLYLPAPSSHPSHALHAHPRSFPLSLHLELGAHHGIVAVAGRALMLFIAALLSSVTIPTIDARSSPIGAFASSPRPRTLMPPLSRETWLIANPSDENDDGKGHEEGRISIEQVALDDNKGLEGMSRFCIDAFYNAGDDGGSMLSKKWKDIKLAAMQKAQLLDISISNADNRCIFIAKDTAASNIDGIVGCCEVIEERIDTQQPSTSKDATTERERRRTARPRPIIENLCVKEEYRRAGVGMALLDACEDAVRRWPGQDEVFAQVDKENVGAFNLFRKCGYQNLFADTTCTKVTLDSTLFREEAVTKWMMRKILEDDGGIF